MATKRDYYQVLSVSKNADGSEIATAYRKLAIKYHPDRTQDDPDGIAKFKEAAEAYEVLSDADKRSRYDQFGHAGVDGGAGQYRDVEDIFEAFGDIFGGGVFDGLFGGRGGGGRRRQRRGGDIRADVTLTLEEAAKGVSKTVTFQRSSQCETCDGSGSAPGSARETCRRCGGHGQVVQSMGFVRVQTSCQPCGGTGSVISVPCSDCRGNGFVATRVSQSVVIPAGIDDGMRVRVSGQGEPSPEGGPPGDVYCFVSVRDHKLFHREGQHLILELPITYTQAALGAIIEVPTLDGPTMLTIPPGTETGKIFRVSGAGLPDPHGGPHVGDMAVKTFIEVPRRLSKKQEELLRELAELEETDVTPHRKSFLEKIGDYFAGSEDE